MRQLKRADFNTGRDYKAAQRELRKADQTKRSGRETRRMGEAE